MSDNTADSINIESVIIEVKESKLSTEIANGVSDIDIFEHLDKPYLTAILGYTDRDSVVANMDISGGEKIHIKIKSNRAQTVSVSKTFFIDKVVLSDKSTDISELYVFHLIEDIGYISSLHNVNRSYSGKPSQIISKISKNFLSKKVEQTPNDFQSMKVIVPNLTPVDAMCWVKNRASTKEGYPYYLYSTLVDDDLQMKDLKSLMTSTSINPDRPFTFSESEFSETVNPPTQKERVIIKYQSKDTENLFKLIKDGLIGSDYHYINVTKNTVDKFSFNVDEEVIKPLKKHKIVDKGTPLFDDGKYKDVTADIKSRRISQVGGSSAHPSDKSYSESEEVAQYRLNIINRAMTHMLTKSKIDFVIEGVELMDGKKNDTLGRKISLRFLRNRLDENDSNVYDSKKSGDFLIFACKHSISRSSYYVTISGVKLSNGEVR
jgi:hypothetical protein